MLKISGPRPAAARGASIEPGCAKERAVWAFIANLQRVSFFPPFLKCEEKWLTGSFHLFRNNTNANDRAPQPIKSAYRKAECGGLAPPDGAQIPNRAG